MQTSDGATLEQRLNESANALSEAVSGFSDDKCRDAPTGRWSVLECIEHIALVQDGFSGRILTSPVGAEAAANPERERELYRTVESRERAVPTPKVVEPRNTFVNLAEAMENFKQTHSRVLNRLKRVELNLRCLQVQHPVLGLLNGYEAFLVIGAHTMRHVAQIHELANEGVTLAK